MKKKNFIAPKLQVVRFSADIISTSDYNHTQTSGGSTSTDYNDAANQSGGWNAPGRQIFGDNDFR